MDCNWISVAKDYHIMGFKLVWTNNFYNAVGLIAVQGCCEIPIKTWDSVEEIPIRLNWLEKL